MDSVRMCMARAELDPVFKVVMFVINGSCRSSFLAAGRVSLAGSAGRKGGAVQAGAGGAWPAAGLSGSGGGARRRVSCATWWRLLAWRNRREAPEMLAVRWHGRGDVRVEEVPPPGPPGPGEVQLRVRWCGICGTDLEEWLSGPVFIPAAAPHPVTGARAPLVLGHEFTGVVRSEERR